MDPSVIKDKIDLYQQIYFTHDEPIPFKGDLLIYPVLVKDYYQFYSLIDIFTVEKNEDKTGIGISMTNLDYLIHMTKSDFPDHEIVVRKIIAMFELIFHIKNIHHHESKPSMSSLDKQKTGVKTARLSRCFRVL